MINLGSKADRIYRELYRQISGGDLSVNARLPTESELCRQYRTSRVPVRSAMQRLAMEGFIETRRGSGSHVKSSGNGGPTVNVIALMYLGDAGLLAAINEFVIRKGCLLSLYSHQEKGWDPALEAMFFREVKRQRHRALLAFGSPLPSVNDRLLAEVDAAGVRVIHYQPSRMVLPSQHFLMPDFSKAGFMAAMHLMLSGRRPLYFIGMEADGPALQLMRAGFMEALRALGGTGDDEARHFIELPKGLPVDPGPWTVSPVEAGAGIVCGSCYRIRFVTEILRQRGLRVPEDVGAVAIETMGDSTAPSDAFDRVEFGCGRLLLRAVELATAPRFDGIRELAPPQLIKAGNVVRLRQDALADKLKPATGR